MVFTQMTRLVELFYVVYRSTLYISQQFKVGNLDGGVAARKTLSPRSKLFALQVSEDVRSIAKAKFKFMVLTTTELLGCPWLRAGQWGERCANVPCEE